MINSVSYHCYSKTQATSDYKSHVQRSGGDKSQLKMRDYEAEAESGANEVRHGG